MLSYKNTLTIIKKELLLYFLSFSNFLVFAAVAAVVVFLFFNNFYLVNAAQLDQLFGLFPWVFALLVPAVTMGIVAGERKSRTLQVLFASPIGLPSITLGKFFGAFTFLAIFPLATVVLPLTLKSVAAFDWGVVGSGYLATLLLLLLFLALGLLVSAFFVNQLAAFVLAFLANFTLIVLGGDLLSSVLPAALVDLIQPISPIVHYTQITRGLIAATDVAYFLTMTAGLVLLAYWQLLNIKYTGSPRKLLIFDRATAGTVAIGLIAASYFTNLIPGQIDLTQQKVFTLSSGAREIIRQLPEPVSVDFYLSRDLPPAFQPRLEDVNRLLDQLTLVNPDQFKVSRRYPQEDPQTAQVAAAVGILPQSFSVLSASEYQAKEGYLGINIKYREDQRAIPFVGETADLEYQLLSRIFELTRTQTPTIVYLQPEGGVPLSVQAQAFVQSLQTTYEFKTVTLPAVDANERLKAEDLDLISMILLTDLDVALHANDIALIKQKVDQGVSLLVFADGLDLNPDMLAASAIEGELPINQVLSDWGVRINPDLVYDLENANLLTFNSPQGNLLVTYPLWPNVGISPEIALLKDLGGVTLPWPSSITIEDTDQVQPLLKTGNFGGVQSESFDLSPQQSLSEENLGQKVVGVIQPRGETNGAIIVVGTANILLDAYGSTRNNNLIFVNQLFDLAGQNQSLASIRAKNRLAPQLVFESQQQKDRLRYMNLAVVPGVVLVIGGGFIYRRKRQ